MSRGFLNSRTNKYRISKTNNIFIVSGSYIVLVMQRKQLKTRLTDVVIKTIKIIVNLFIVICGVFLVFKGAA